MSILLMIDRKLPSEQEQAPTSLPHYKPIVQAIGVIKRNCFDIDYAMDVVTATDDAKFSFAKYKSSFNIQEVVDKFKDYKVIILMGEDLCKILLDKPMKDLVNKATKVMGKVFICMHSPYKIAQAKSNCLQPFSLALNHYDGNVVEKDFCDYEIVRTIDRLREVIAYRHITKIVSFDFETISDNPEATAFDYAFEGVKATVLSLTFQPGYSYIIPFEHREFSWGDDFNPMLDLIHALLTDGSVLKIAHNLKFDFNFLTAYGIGLTPRIADTMVMAHVLNENRRFGLKKLNAEYFPFWKGYDDEVDFRGPLEQLSKYAAMDTNVTLMLYYILNDELLQDGNEKLYRLFRNLKMPALFALQEMEYNGAKLDRDLMIKSTEKAKQLLQKKENELNEYSEVAQYVKATNAKLVQEEIDRLEEAIEKIKTQKIVKDEKANLKLVARKEKAQIALDKELAKPKPNPKSIAKHQNMLAEPFIDSDIHDYVKYAPYIVQLRGLKTGQVRMYEKVNYNSPKQLQEVLYDVFEFPVPIVGRERKRSVDRKYISEFKHPFITTFSAFKTISKMLSTYYTSMLEKLDHNDLIHTSFKLTGTKTHRLSSAGPNLQNIPARLNFKDDDAEWCLKMVKKFFIPRADDSVIIQADYSQAELRVIANFAKEKNMQEAYLNGYDMHTYTGAAIAGMGYDEFLATKGTPEFKEKRSAGKGANFSLLYGAGPSTVIEAIYKDTGIKWSKQEEAHVRDMFYRNYPKLKEYYIIQERRGKRDEYVETLLGARRRFLNLNSPIQTLVSHDLRNSINSPVQGTAGELTILAIALLYHRLPKSCIMWSTVHDSIFFEIKKSELHLLEVIKETCENIPLDIYFNIKKEDFPVSMKIDFEVSDKSWKDLEETTVEDIYKQVANMADA